MIDDLADLDDSIEALTEAIKATAIRGDFLIPDLVAVGFARDVFENAVAVRHLATSIVPRAVYPSARAAFEAVFELVTLITDPDYGAAGCRARVVELLEAERSRKLVREVLRYDGRDGEIMQSGPVADQVEEEAKGWDRFAPGRGDMLRDAFKVVLSDRQRRPPQWNWFRSSRVEMQRKAAPKIGGGLQTEKMLESWYQLLSAQSHPSPRIDSHNLIWDDDLTFVFGVPDDKHDAVIGLATGGARIAAKAARLALKELAEELEEK